MIPGISYDDGFLLVSPILDDGLMVFSKKKSDSMANFETILGRCGA
jgi:hypothetical protein